VSSCSVLKSYIRAKTRFALVPGHDDDGSARYDALPELGSATMMTVILVRMRRTQLRLRSARKQTREQTRDQRAHGAAFSRHELPEGCTVSPLNCKRGGECRATASPVARQQKEKLAADTTGPAGSTRHSLRDGFNAYVVLSLGTGLSCSHHPHRSSRCELGASVGAPGPHDFASASASFVRARSRAPPKRPSHPAPRVVTIAKRPSCRSGT